VRASAALTLFFLLVSACGAPGAGDDEGTSESGVTSPTTGAEESVCDGDGIGAGIYGETLTTSCPGPENPCPTGLEVSVFGSKPYPGDESSGPVSGDNLAVATFTTDGNYVQALGTGSFWACRFLGDNYFSCSDEIVLDAETPVLRVDYLFANAGPEWTILPCE